MRTITVSRSLIGAPILLLSILTACAASADMIRFKDGTRMRGTIIKQTPTEVTVRFNSGTSIFAPSDIVGVEQEEAGSAAAVPTEPAERASPRQRLRMEEANTEAPPEPAAQPGEAAVETPEEATLLDAMRGVVFILTQYKDKSIGMGSGAIVSRKGIVVTNYHVIADAERIEVFLPDKDAKISTRSGRPYQAYVLKTDPCYDLAVLRVPLPTPQYLHFADDEGLQTGMEVRAVGNPKGLTVSATKGIVSAVRSIKDLTGGIEQFDLSKTRCGGVSDRVLDDFTLVQTDAAINPGNSGGPLLNERNDIVGINSYGMVQSQGLNFAIHAKHARKLVGSYTKE